MDITKAYRYCPRCGKNFKVGQQYLECEACGLHYYINPKACTGVALYNSEQEFLLVRRAVDPMKGFWDLPGGFVDEDENLEESARRELQEELGIKVGDLSYVCSCKDRYVYQDIEFSTIGILFLAKLKGDEKFKPDDDIDYCEFFKLEDMPMDRIAFPSIKELFVEVERLKLK
ncbi:MAG: NUDIX hydrolase [Candidatus Saccharimonadales bacterium]